MSLLLKDRVYSMEAKTAKRGVYPLHGYKLGLYRLPIVLQNPLELQSVHDGLKKAFEMDMYADRIYATYRWTERNDEEEIEIPITVEIVTGEVVDIIYQVYPLEKYGDHHWIKDYRKKADHFAKMVIDTILRNTILADKLISYFVKTHKISEITAIQKLEDMTPLAKIVLGAKAKVVKKTDEEEEDVGEIEIPDGAKPGPIDIEYKSKMKPSKPYETDDGYKIKTWGRKGANNEVMGVWGEFVSVDYDICTADGGCIEACPVDVYEWFDTPGNVSSERKPLMAREETCIFCLACENVCPPQAIKIFENK